LRFVCNFSFGVPTLWAGPRFGAWNLGFHRFIIPADSLEKERLPEPPLGSVRSQSI
jgi:hypothetical protein